MQQVMLMSRTHTVQLRMSDDDLAGLDAVAAALGTTRSDVLRRGLAHVESRHRNEVLRREAFEVLRRMAVEVPGTDVRFGGRA